MLRDSVLIVVQSKKIRRKNQEVRIPHLVVGLLI